jgi:glycosyltransferase involved in cell wall biosynthesis
MKYATRSATSLVPLSFQLAAHMITEHKRMGKFGDLDREEPRGVKRTRILLSSFAFSPFGGSEGGVGWEIATRLARHHDVTVLCGDVAAGRPTEKALNRYFQMNRPIPGLTVHYVAPTRLTAVLTWLHGKPGLWALYYAAYGVWQRKAFATALQLHASRPFDLSHQLTYATYREPGYLWRLPIPVFWGPIAGAADVPLSFATIFGFRAGIALACRRVTNAIQCRLSFRARRAARHASMVWACTDAERCLIEKWGGRSELQREVGTTPSTIQPRTRRDGGLLRIAWSGIHEPRKALPIALEAVAVLKERVAVVLDVLGDGPESERCRRIADRLGISSQVVWHGTLPRIEALEIMQNADALLHTSVREGTSTVVVEALSLGLPVICHDACGMAVAVTGDCGIKVPLKNPKISISGFASAIERLANDCELYNRLALGARNRAEELTWDCSVERFSAAYSQPVGKLEVPSMSASEPAVR